ncbi:hypothetical protein [uncultured Clostridium sp.]|uniref:hypothetical protein n=1 Tax=uncultured Clostridium sp. TaxID=59620 RepID=UPI0026181444|nr:hypothetical protein [uncultured Clostridium sp.]
MNSIISLLKYNIINTYGINRVFQKKNKKEILKTIGIGVLFIYLIGLVIVFTDMVAKPAIQLGLGDIILLQGILLSIGLIGFTSIYKMAGYIFGNKDYNTLCAMPISSFKIIIIKIITVILPTYLIMLICMLPSFIIYSMNVQTSPFFLVYAIIMLLVIPMIPVSIATFIGTIILYVTSKMKGKNFFTVIIFLVITIGAIFLPQIMIQNITENVEKYAKSVNEIVYAVYPPTRFYIGALVNGSFKDFIIFISLSLIIFIVFVLFVSKVFNRVNSRLQETTMKNNYKMGELKESSVIKSLVINEIKKLFSMPMVTLNVIIGAIMYIIFGAATIFAGKNILEEFASLGIQNLELAGVCIVGVLCLMLTTTTATSISLEGNKLWFLKVMPVDVMKIFKAKIATNLMITIPSVLIGTILSGIGLKLSIIDIILTLILLLIVAILMPALGLIINLLFPVLNWTSEIAVVKRSTATMIMTFGGMGLTFIIGFIYVKIKIDLILYIMIIGILALVGIIACMSILSKWGKNRFLNL